MGLLKDKVCLVTGTNRGIGAATLRRFAEEGAIVYANSRTVGKMDDICKELGERYKTTVIPVYFDVKDEKTAKEVIMSIKKRYNRLDVLVNNAGVMKDALIGMITTDLMKEIFEVNVYATVNMLQLANKLMCRQKSGSIINMSSIVGITGNIGQTVYSASKGAVATLTKTASKELAPYNIRVNAVAPGMIDTDMFRSIGGEKVQEHLGKIRMGRLGTPEEIANACVFLASDLSQYVTGQILGVNGATII